MDCPILVWMLTFNRDLTTEEYDQCYNTMRTCVSHASVTYQPGSRDSVLKIISYLMPLVMMRHRRVSRHRWRDQVTENGKHWIEMQDQSGMIHQRTLRSMIGYYIAHHTNLVGMVMTQGLQHHVINLGLAIEPLTPDPPNASISAYLESQFHKLTRNEIDLIRDASTDQRSESTDDMVMRRLCMLLTLKQAYIRAIGQPLGFDYTRLEFDVPNQLATGDGKALYGWEFRVWQACIEVMRPDGTTIEQRYQCASAFFRGIHDISFVWQKDAKELESWVQFLTPDQLMAVMPKLTD
ncbi:hypothetical protein BXZ70DRAFT_1039821 [Cristinia sonorae]|uniref:holo-[acyl-carrier-protein] synthase n=1 Tax=Cristinia sonorae TaxID=1940300 RepID=A0A8K0XME9_9AGAR|nr:hypothetical protein BXZ70DRAFT_1039821 [Cristinia sonorae]